MASPHPYTQLTMASSIALRTARRAALDRSVTCRSTAASASIHTGRPVLDSSPSGSSPSGSSKTTHFGFRDVPEAEKETLGELRRSPSVLQSLQGSRKRVFIRGVKVRPDERFHVPRYPPIMERFLRLVRPTSTAALIPSEPYFNFRPSCQRAVQMSGCCRWHRGHCFADIGSRAGKV